MVKYIENGDVAIIDGYRFRRDKKTGYFLSSKKINGKRRRLHVYIAETYIGKIEKGYDVHHKDENKNNNEIDNLEIISKHNHQVEHGRRLTDEERKRRAVNVTSNANPMSKKWHSSEEGIEWHRKHGYDTAQKRKALNYTCTNCGKGFQSKKIVNDPNANCFCSNNCKSAYRRKLGIDNEPRICKNCGNKFEANKYGTKMYCDECKNQKHKICRS